jgi:hypothetical protein
VSAVCPCNHYGVVIVETGAVCTHTYCQIHDIVYPEEKDIKNHVNYHNINRYNTDLQFDSLDMIQKYAKISPAIEADINIVYSDLVLSIS